MSIGVVVGFLAIASGLVPHVWAFDLPVLNPPPMHDETNSTKLAEILGFNPETDIDSLENAPLPFFSVDEDVRFELYTMKNPKEAQVLELNNYTTVKKSHFNWLRPTRIIVHGWMSDETFVSDFADAFFDKGKHKINLIAVTWRKGSSTLNYWAARQRVRPVAAHLAQFIDFMHEKAWLSIKDLTIIGHSLGAHVSGLAAKQVTKGKVGKIVGLDPALPLFKHSNVDDRLASTDASYVEVIHTCAGLLGFSKPIGSASFYPNGGKSQPGCGHDFVGSCAHLRSYDLFLESLNTPKLVGFECESFENLQHGKCTVVNDVVQMGGEPGNKHGNGIFYLETNEKPIYGMGVNQLLHAIVTANGPLDKLRILKYLLKSLVYESWKK